MAKEKIIEIEKVPEGISKRIAALELYKQLSRIKNLSLLSITSYMFILIIYFFFGLLFAAVVVLLFLIGVVFLYLYPGIRELKRLEITYNIDPKTKM